MISFAGAGPNTRGTDMFITFMTGNANGTPRAPWETPFGIIDEEGLKAVTSFYPEYGDFKSFGGNAPELGRGYDSFKKTHPNLDYLGKCTLVYKYGHGPATTRKAEPSTAAPQPAPQVDLAARAAAAAAAAEAGEQRARARGMPVEPEEFDTAAGSSGEFRHFVILVVVVVVLLVVRRMAGYRRPLYYALI